MKTSLRLPLIKQLQAEALIATLSLAALGAGAAYANDLFNPDLDVTAVGPQVNAPPAGWAIDATKTISGVFNDGADSEGFCNVQQPGGQGLFFKPFQGSTNLVNDLLTVNFYQDNPATPGTKVTLSGYAACEPNFCELFGNPNAGPTQQPSTVFFVAFLDNGGSIISSNAFDLLANGMSTNGPGTMNQLTTPQYTAPAGTVVVRVGTGMLNAFGTTGGQSFFVDAFDLESVPPAGSPVITNPPVAATVAFGGSAVFNVGVSNTAGATYQWQYEGGDLSNGGQISGATTASLTISGVTTNNIGHYRVRVSNASGSVLSQNAVLAIDQINFFPVVGIYGVLGSTYQVSSSSTVNGIYTPASAQTS